MRIEPLTESSCIVYLGEGVDPLLVERVGRAAAAIRGAFGAGAVDVVPAFASVHVTVNPDRLPVLECCRKLEALLSDVDAIPPPPVAARHFDIPAYYGAEAAPDLAEVARLTGLSEVEVISRHSQHTYRVYAIGFAPGFCFLGLTDELLNVSRRAEPRVRVPAGSIGIAERQTAVYPVDTPGGWQLIGRTYVDMLSLCNDEANPLRVGDEVRFVQVGRDNYLANGGTLE